MKQLLIISPYFPPTNAADMQRVRMSLPYFGEFDWNAEVVCVDDKYCEMVKDSLLVESLPANVTVHKVQAFSRKWTSKLGLGSIALRALYFYVRAVNALLKQKKIDLIYFSTTQFPVCILGPYWKKKFGIPYVIDMQDPWHSDYYEDKPKNERPPKYWFSYRLNKWLEPIAMKKVGGLIAVSSDYIKTLKQRYPGIQKVPEATITFGAFSEDFAVLQSKRELKPAINKENKLALVYVGRGGHDLRDSLTLIFTAFKQGLMKQPEIFKHFHFYFIGTSYAPGGRGENTILPIAESLSIQEYVSEQTDRIPFYQGLKTLETADGFIIPGSNDPSYTASKLYPYILAQKPLLGLFHENSSAVRIIRDCRAGEVLTLKEPGEKIYTGLSFFLSDILKGSARVQLNWDAFQPYTAKEMCKKQVALFEKVIS